MPTLTFCRVLFLVELIRSISFPRPFIISLLANYMRAQERRYIYIFSNRFFISSVYKPQALNYTFKVLCLDHTYCVSFQNKYIFSL